MAMIDEQGNLRYDQDNPYAPPRRKRYSYEGDPADFTFDVPDPTQDGGTPPIYEEGGITGDRGDVTTTEGGIDRATYKPPEPAPPPQPPPAPAPRPPGVPPGPSGAPPSPYVPQNYQPTTVSQSQPSQLDSLLMSMLTQQRKPNPQREALLSKLTGLVDRYTSPVNAEDPDIANAANAYEGDVQRGVNRYREFAAERGRAEGVPSGAFDAQVANAMQQGARAAGANRAGLIRDETLSRRGTASDLLGKSASLLEGDETRNLQDRIATMDSILKDKGLDINEELGKGRLGLDEMLGLKDLDLRGQDLALRGELGRGQLGVAGAGVGAQTRGQDLANQQFYDDLAFRQSKEANDLDQLMAQLMLSGG